MSNTHYAFTCSVLIWIHAVLASGCGVDSRPQMVPLPGGAQTGRAPGTQSGEALHSCKVEAGQECALPACGCPADQTCAPDYGSKDFMLRCQPHNRFEGEKCGKGQQCAPGLFCSEAGYCVELCSGDAECAQPVAGSCTTQKWWGKDKVAARGCAVLCDPRSPQSPAAGLTACPAGYGCDPVRPGILNCTQRSGSTAVGAACASDEMCAPGSVCRDERCVPYCDDDSDCALLGDEARCMAHPDRGGVLKDLKLCSADPARGTRDGGAGDDAANEAGTDPVPLPDAGECDPGERSCDGAVPRRCTERGTWEEDTITSGRCGAVCMPGETTCDRTILRTCGRDGQWEGTSVEAGTCGAECTPGNEECDGVALRRCTEQGVWELQDVEGGVCDASCTPDEEGCRGPVLWTCGSAGTWGNARVVSGSCGAVCNPGELSCNGVTSFLCGRIGQWLPGAIVEGVCGAICSAGDTTCDGTVRLTCSGGLAWVDPVISTDCGAACDPGSETCEDGRLFTCTRNGVWGDGVVSTRCGAASSSCTPGQVACGLLDDPFVCSPDASGCAAWSSNAGDVYLTICDETGTWVRSDCTGMCNGGSHGIVYYCYANGSDTGCYSDGICPGL